VDAKPPIKVPFVFHQRSFVSLTTDWRLKFSRFQHQLIVERQLDTPDFAHLKKKEDWTSSPPRLQAMDNC
jgi:hypothetical protein